MLIVGLFTKYFLILMLVEGYIVGILDARFFYKNNMKKTAIKARILGVGFMVLGLALFALREIM